MNLKLLLAEDDKELRELLIENLSLESFDVMAFNCAEDALDAAEEYHFDLALFDVVMGGMTGIEALTSLRRLQPNIGIIITTAFASVDVAVDAMKRGADEFLIKPLNLQMLSVALKSIHTRRSSEALLDEHSNDLIFGALANPIRRQVIKQLKLHRKMKFMDLCRVVGVEDHTKFNFHLRQLVNSGLVKKNEERIYSLTQSGVRIFTALFY